MGAVISGVIAKAASPPKPPGGEAGAVVFAIINCVFFGVGSIIVGILGGPDWIVVLIGLLQLLLPFVGWVWSVIWAVMWLLPLCKGGKCGKCKCKGSKKVLPGARNGRPKR
uniref:Transmembrane protein n=1 Tax=Bicosoecida sp. CB-2014 TaxID=1486930 RepID=A0A7S1CGI7_9STRA